MTHSELILEELDKNSPKGICDDCLSLLLDVTPRQQTNQICNRLAKEKRIIRRKGACMMGCETGIRQKWVNSSFNSFIMNS